MISKMVLSLLFVMGKTSEKTVKLPFALSQICFCLENSFPTNYEVYLHCTRSCVTSSTFVAQV